MYTCLLSLKNIYDGLNNNFESVLHHESIMTSLLVWLSSLTCVVQADIVCVLMCTSAFCCVQSNPLNKWSCKRIINIIRPLVCERERDRECVYYCITLTIASTDDTFQSRERARALHVVPLRLNGDWRAPTGPAMPQRHSAKHRMLTAKSVTKQNKRKTSHFTKRDGWIGYNRARIVCRLKKRNNTYNYRPWAALLRLAVVCSNA